MQGIYKSGSKIYSGPYRHTNVLLYLVSVLLKANCTSGSHLSKSTGINIKTAQRYYYNNYEREVVNSNLNDINLILEYINISFSELFKYVDIFIKNEYILAVYNINNNSMSMFNYIYEENKQELFSLLQERKRMIHNYGSVFMKPYKIYFNSRICQFSSQLIKELKINT